MNLNSTILASVTLIAFGVFLTACAQRMASDDSEALALPVTVISPTALSVNRYEEAPLPLGFAEPTVVMQPMLITVPAHRAVEAQSFSQCFQHIKRNDIPMTAPVYMSMESQGTALPRSMKHMRFLFPSPDTKSSVIVPGARVVDVPEKEVLIMYMQGVMSDDRTLNSLTQMRRYLMEHYPQLRIVSDVQILGYNSPFVLPWKKLWALQLEVEVKSDADSILSL